MKAKDVPYDRNIFASSELDPRQQESGRKRVERPGGKMGRTL